MKTARKLLSLLLVLTMVLSLSITAFAADPTTGTLTVHGDQLGGKNVTAVLMFTANVKSEDNMIDKDDSVGYELVPAWQEFIDGKLNKAADANATSEEAYEYVKALTGDDLEAFAEAAMKYAKANKINGTTETADETSDTATFTNLTAGYYLVYPEAGSTSVARGTEAMLVNVPSSTASNLNIKSEYPTVDKVVENVEDVSAQIGKNVTYTLTSKVPEMSDYDTYAFWFVDQMSKGLTLKQDTIKVEIVDAQTDETTVLTKDTDYTVEVAAASENAGQKLSIKFADLKKVTSAAAGDTIRVTYDATVNANAVIGVNTNEAHVEYSNDPDNDGDGHTPGGHSDEDDAKVYVTEIIVDKYTGTYGTDAERLSGAVFTLKEDDGETVIKLVDKGNKVYRVATPEEITADDAKEATEKTLVTQVTTGTDGKIKIEGLAAGTYYLEEIAAPTGYNKLAEDVKIEITFVEATAEKDAHFTYKVGNAVDASVSPTIPVENKTGAVLPETGAMGTIGLTIFGVMVVILGIALPRKKNARA